MTEHENRSALDEAMAEALESVEQRERDAASRDEQATVEVEVEQPEPNAETEELQKLKDQLVRMAADFDNFRKRSRKEIEDARKFGIEAFLRHIVPVVDNFERALDAGDDDEHPVVQGIKMVHKQFLDALAQQGVKSFSSVGEIFDPELHEALSQFESADHKPGEITNEHERGYMIHGRLFRPARVVVAMPPVKPADEVSEDNEAADAVDEETSGSEEG